MDIKRKRISKNQMFLVIKVYEIIDCSEKMHINNYKIATNTTRCRVKIKSVTKIGALCQHYYIDQKIL